VVGDDNLHLQLTTTTITLNLSLLLLGTTENVSSSPRQHHFDDDLTTNKASCFSVSLVWCELEFDMNKKEVVWLVYIRGGGCEIRKGHKGGTRVKAS